MNEFKGTPGPWEALFIHGDLRVIRSGSLRREGRTALSYQSVSGDIDDEADAKLIASAPELLEHLQKCVEALDEVSYQSWCEPIIDEARAAIAKALGESK